MFSVLLISISLWSLPCAVAENANPLLSVLSLRASCLQVPSFEPYCSFPRFLFIVTFHCVISACYCLICSQPFWNCIIFLSSGVNSCSNNWLCSPFLSLSSYVWWFVLTFSSWVGCSLLSPPHSPLPVLPHFRFLTPASKGPGPGLRPLCWPCGHQRTSSWESGGRSWVLAHSCVCIPVSPGLWLCVSHNTAQGSQELSLQSLGHGLSDKPRSGPWHCLREHNSVIARSSVAGCLCPLPNLKNFEVLSITMPQRLCFYRTLFERQCRCNTKIAGAFAQTPPAVTSYKTLRHISQPGVVPDAAKTQNISITTQCWCCQTAFFPSPPSPYPSCPLTCFPSL